MPRYNAAHDEVLEFARAGIGAAGERLRQRAARLAHANALPNLDRAARPDLCADAHAQPDADRHADAKHHAEADPDADPERHADSCAFPHAAQRRADRRRHRVARLRYLSALPARIARHGGQDFGQIGSDGHFSGGRAQRRWRLAAGEPDERRAPSLGLGLPRADGAARGGCLDAACDRRSSGCHACAAQPCPQ